MGDLVGPTCGIRGLAVMIAEQSETVSPVKGRARLIQESRRVSKEVIDAYTLTAKRPDSYKTDSEALVAVSRAARAVGVKVVTPGGLLHKAYETARLVYEHSELRPLPALLGQTLVAIVEKTKRNMEKKWTPSVSAGELVCGEAHIFKTEFSRSKTRAHINEPSSFDKAWRAVHYGIR